MGRGGLRLLRGIAVLAGLLLALLGAAPVCAEGAAGAAGFPQESHYRCGGDPLSAVFQPGAVDATAIPNQSAGTAPGSFLLVRWRGIQLQLPRTNDAGPPSFSDGKWWWSVEQPDHPQFRLRQGLGPIEEFACEPLG